MKNIHKVNHRNWNKWGDIGQKVFNGTYELLKLNREIMLHPKTPRIPEDEWNTVAWNAAWLAADAAIEE